MQEQQIQMFEEFMEALGYAQRTIQLYSTHLKWLLDFQIIRERDALYEHIKRKLKEVKPCCTKSKFHHFRAASGLYFRMRAEISIKDYEEIRKEPGRFDDVLGSFYEHSITIKKMLPASVKSERSHVNQFLVCVIGESQKIDFQAITAEEVRDYVCSVLSNLTDSSKGRYVTSIRNFFRYLEYEGFSVHQSVFKLALSPFAWRQQTVPTTLTENEVQRLLSYFEGNTPSKKRDLAIFLALLDLGLRCSEIPSLKLSDIQWERGEIVIRKTKTRRERALPISNRLGKALEEYMLHIRVNSLDGYLFQRLGKRYEGEAMNTEGVRRVIRLAFQKLQIEGWWKGTHTIRRTAASRIFNSGNSLKLTADILGHDSIQSTTAYIKIDIKNLEMLAGDWPTGGTLS